MTPDRATAQVVSDLLYLEESWPLIVASKIPGSTRSWVETPRHGVMDEATAEQLGKKGVVRKAPAMVGVLDLLASIATVIDDVARTVVDVAQLGTDFLPFDSAAKDPRPWLKVAATWVVAAQEHDKATTKWVAFMIRPLVSQTERLLGDVRNGQVLNGVCPWCGGRTSSGVGERTLQIRYPDPDDTGDEEIIFCFGTNCRPPVNACEKQWRGHPAWSRREWDWLAAQLTTPDRVQRQKSIDLDAVHVG